ncbi:MAG: type II toxin-antitoxin system RelE/ParE family toxin [Flavisolibacter sp.]|nr:type II toxin-antitoxin system RelE/ParE family toxin [Flavisolibacter sp.]MBD0294948.1 type II toxin-antitoxin system RelE/ParE family toxin [Flavisolibacter sp.]MBD0352100.1 type II toxin-antitoxin system RelE/ParE family toxin [Flavisolibacter sp.]MBD0376878.1 type II toxin-antitoxin system RelE/ParE family toxin [Flavisolibacter sp.]
MVQRERSKQASENFEAAVDERINLLRSQPDRYKKSYKQFHEVVLKKFPYSILYLINEKEKQVVISSIYHHRRNPEKKYRKRG